MATEALPIEFRVSEPSSAGAGRAPTLLLAHGAGAGMDSKYLEAVAGLLAGRGVRVVRFEFAYMAERRRSGKRGPPPRGEAPAGEYRAAADACPGVGEGALFIGGKSLGGRVASMVADDLFRSCRIKGLVCLGYPFHPPGQPDKLRTAHLAALACPALIVQGTADPFGTREEVMGYRLSPAIRIHWLDGGDHDHKLPRESGGAKGGLRAAAEAVAEFCLP